MRVYWAFVGVCRALLWGYIWLFCGNVGLFCGDIGPSLSSCISSILLALFGVGRNEGIRLASFRVFFWHCVDWIWGGYD